MHSLKCVHNECKTEQEIAVERTDMTCLSSGGFRGGATGAPLKFDRLFLFCIFPFCIRRLKNKAQIARESIKNPRASRALKRARALDPAVRDFGLRARDVRART